MPQYVQSLYRSWLVTRIHSPPHPKCVLLATSLPLIRSLQFGGASTMTATSPADRGVAAGPASHSRDARMASWISGTIVSTPRGRVSPYRCRALPWPPLLTTLQVTYSPLAAMTGLSLSWSSMISSRSCGRARKALSLRYARFCYPLTPTIPLRHLFRYPSLSS